MGHVSEVARYRAGMAKLLAESIARSGKIERSLDAAVDDDVVSKQASLEADPIGAVRIMCALLLRKARLHVIAVLRANQSCNVHSLAVQARPVLECAGQVVLLFHNMVIAPEKGEGVVGDYLDADFYGTIARLTKGEVGHQELLRMISSASGEPEGKQRRRGRLRQADKVVMLKGGKGWYDFLSEYFCHGNGNLRGSLGRGRRLDEYVAGRVRLRRHHGLLGKPSGRHERLRNPVPHDGGSDRRTLGRRAGATQGGAREVQGAA